VEGGTVKIRNEIKAGVFVFVSLALIAALILIMGRERQIFAKQSEFFATFKDVKGLAEGSPVRLGGISIGRVARVGFSKDLSDTRVHVTLLVNDAYLERVRPDSMVAIETQGLLGDRFVSISPGTQVGVTPPGSTLPSAEVADFAQILHTAQAAVDNTTEITQRINRSLEGLSPDTFTNLAAAAKSISDIFEAIKTEEGFLHRIIYDEKDGKMLVRSLSLAAQDISETIREVKTGNGLLHALIFEESGKQTVESILRTSEGLATLFKQVKDGRGLAHDLLYTPVEPGAISMKLQTALAAISETANNLKIASSALAHGQGTLGALIVDPQLYDNLVEITGGAKRSFLLRQAIRSSLKR
jgi:phospholipid/cholesterol/gamma-HCH transport system substrate-binding protein